MMTKGRSTIKSSLETEQITLKEMMELDLCEKVQEGEETKKYKKIEEHIAILFSCLEKQSEKVKT